MKFVLIDRWAVDLESLFSLEHECQPSLCREKKCCCATYDVTVGLDELQRIVQMMPRAAQWGPHIADMNDFRTVFSDQGGNEYLIDTLDDEYCVLSYFGHHGEPLCTLHTAAIDLGLAPSSIKPQCCTLWPLAVQPGDLPTLTIHEDAFDFVCNRKRSSLPLDLDPGVAQLLESRFGKDFRSKVERAGPKFLVPSAKPKKG